MTDNRKIGPFHATSQRVWLHWIFLSTCLNFGWEILHFPLYSASSTHAGGIPVWAIIHCTLGDALISAFIFLITSVLLRTLNWPFTYPRRGLFFFVVLAVTYTAFSEWRNTEIIGSWNYAPAMPQLWGIGVAPLLQWVAVPSITLWLQIGIFNPNKRRQ